MKKKVYLAQVNAVYGEGESASYLSYSIGSLAAYAWADDKIKETYELCDFIYKRENPEKVLESIKDPFLVGFSSYVWNMQYNLKLAALVKEKHPQCLILFGGHNASSDSADLARHPFIDILVHGEGEIPFRSILIQLEKGEDLDDIANISYRTADGDLHTTQKQAQPDIGDFPSPFLEGYFDKMMEDENMKFSLIWETNRGCPHMCAYCDWGELSSKVRTFPMQRIRDEIKWMAENKIEYIYCADANFGILDRDEELIDLIVESKLKTGYPQKFKTNFTKGREEFVVGLGKKLMDHQIGKSPTLSFQTLNPTALENINRKNMNLEHFNKLIALYASMGITVYSEMILGLPGETYESFTQGLCTLLENGQHKSIGVYPCELLPNALVSDPDYMEKHGIKAQLIPFSQYHCTLAEDDIQEYSYTVIETATMPREDWIRSYMFSIYIQGLHNLGLTRALAIYLRYEKDVSYLDFYEKLIEYSKTSPKDSLLNSEYSLIEELTRGATEGENAFTFIFDGLGNITWGMEEHVFLNFARFVDEFYDEVASFLEGFDIRPDSLENLLTFQKGIVRKLKAEKIELELDFDFYNYFENIYMNNYEPLLAAQNKLIFYDESPAQDWEEYAKFNMWYGRRDEKQLYTNAVDKIEVTFD
ncbi:MAG: radical SAM protein [Clostridiales bacterium]|nr:radical SAM protein [Clostridiales bacterium]